MDDKRSRSDDKQQKQPRRSRLAKKLCEPKTWFFIVKLGLTAYKAGKLIIKLIELIGF